MIYIINSDLDTKIYYPNYSLSFVLLDGINSCTIDTNGYIQVHGSNGAYSSTTAVDKPIYRVTINGNVVSEVHGNGVDTNAYTSFRSALYPVSVGDIVAITTASWNQYNRVLFYSCKTE